MGVEMNPIVFEVLEKRLLLSATCPVIDAVVADNRGQVVLNVNRDLNAATVNSTSIEVFTAGSDLLLGTADDVLVNRSVSYDATARTITINASIQPNERYRVRLDSSIIKGTNGIRLDGEFNGANVASGDGVAGGDFEVFSRRSLETIARLTTVAGTIDVRLFADRTPLTAANFKQIADSGIWDGTFFHRSVQNFVIQAGGFKAASGFGAIPPGAPVKNEPGISNLRGTIAMAKQANNPNSATNQWFFNLGDNSANLDAQNGGFTAFGEIVNAAGLSVMDAIAAFDRVNATRINSAFTDVPVQDAAAVQARNGTIIPSDVATISRIAILVDLSGQPAQQLSTAGSIVVTNPNGQALVRLFDLDGVGLPQAADAIRVFFGANDSIRSVQIVGSFSANARFGLQISGASTIGTIMDRRRNPAGDLAFIVTNAPVAFIRASHSITGFNLNGVVLPGQILDEDIDGDGSISDSLALLIPGGHIRSLIVLGGLGGDVVTGNISRVFVRGTTDQGDFVFSDSKFSTFRFGSVLDSNIRTNGRIATIFAREWRDTQGGPEIIRAQSIRTIVTTGGRGAQSKGDFDAGLSLSGDPLGAPALMVLNVRGNVFGANWDIQGEARFIRIGGTASFLTANVAGNLRTFIAGALRGVNISSDGAVTIIRASEWTGGFLTAQSVRVISIAGRSGTGDFDVDVTLSGSTSRLPTLSRLFVAGSMSGGTLNVAGNVGTLFVRRGLDNATINITQRGNLRFARFGDVRDSNLTVDGTVSRVIAGTWDGGSIAGREYRSVFVLGDFTADLTTNILGRLTILNGSLRGDITVFSAQSIDVRGDVIGSVILVNDRSPGVRPKLGRFSVRGEMRQSSLRSAQDIGTISLGAMRDSDIHVGFVDGAVGIPDNADQLQFNSTLRTFIIRGLRQQASSMINSSVVAAHIRSAFIREPSMDNFGQPFGIAAQTIDLASAFVGRTRIATNTRFGTVAQGDFQIRIGFVPPA